MPNGEDSNPIDQPDPQKAWEGVMAKLSDDERECMTLAINAVQKTSFGAGYRMGWAAANAKRKERNKNKRLNDRN